MTATTAQNTAPAGVAPDQPSTATGGNTRRFLTEVQALRALAVVLVVVYHISPTTLPGGYVGVDVFFVISGFLITGHLWREASRTGRVSLKKFWAARARRILPASLVTTVGVVIGALLLLPLTEVEKWWQQALASVLYVENWVLARDSVDYQAAENVPTAFQHFWSLGVEEQFYLFWPLLVVGAVAMWRVGARGTSRPADPAVLRGLLLVIFGLVIAASFWFGLARVNAGDPSAYYSTLTRTWQLAVGGFLALVWTDTRRMPQGRAMLAVVGIAAIVAAACLYGPGTPFPGVHALLPTLGAVAWIAAGRTEGPGSLRPIAETWVIQRIGDISYSLYLWHFPVVVFFGLRMGDRAPTIAEAIAMVATSFALALGSYVLVERPIRKGSFFRPDGRMLVSALVAMALVAGLTALLPLRINGTSDNWEEKAQEVDANLGERGATATGDGLEPFVGDSTEIAPSPLEAELDRHEESYECLANVEDPETVPCTFDPPGEVTATVAVVGDSHAAMFVEPVLDIARERGWKVVTYLHGGCPYTTEKRTGRAAVVDACSTANAVTRERLRELNPDGVVATNYEATAIQDSGTGKDPGVAGYAEVWNELEDAGTQVVVVRDSPVAREDVIECVGENYEGPEACARPRDEALGRRIGVPGALELAPRVRTIELNQRFCTEAECPAVIGNVLVYRDNHHVSRTFAKTLTPLFRQELEQFPSGPQSR